MTITRNPQTVARTVPEGKIDWIGTVRGRQFGRYRNQEYAVDLRGTGPENFVPQEGEILVIRKRPEILEDGAVWETDTTCRGWPVAAGTYEQLVNRRRKAAAEKPMRAWDRLGELAVLQRREPIRMVTGPASSAYDRLPTIAGSREQQEAIAGAVDLANRNPSRQLIEVGGNEPPERSVAGLIAFIEQRGVELTLKGGRLLARSRDPIRGDVRELIEQARELIVGHLQGKPVLCSSCAEPAVAIAFPDCPACSSHTDQ